MNKESRPAKIKMANGIFCLVDIEDYGFLSKFRWCLTKSGYAYHGFWKDGKCSNIRMHRLITKAPKNKMVDHINWDKLDNRKENLRICSNSQNQINSSKKQRGSSIYKGVFKVPRSKTWWSRIGVRGRKISLGHFKTEKEAALAYNGAAKKYHGEYAWINKI